MSKSGKGQNKNKTSPPWMFRGLCLRSSRHTEVSTMWGERYQPTFFIKIFGRLFFTCLMISHRLNCSILSCSSGIQMSWIRRHDSVHQCCSAAWRKSPYSLTSGSRLDGWGGRHHCSLALRRHAPVISRKGYRARGTVNVIKPQNFAYTLSWKYLAVQPVIRTCNHCNSIKKKI